MDVLADIDPRFHYQTANLNGVQYNYIHAEPASGKTAGTVFLVHGWPDLSLGWSNHISFLLSKGLRVVALDMMGYGGTESPKDPSFYTFKRASDDIAALASYLGLSRIILGGHDWGGGVVYRAAMWHPELVAAFYVLNTPFVAPQALYVYQALEWPGFHYQLQLRTNAIQDYIGPVNAQNVTRVRQILNTIYIVTGPSNELAINVTDVRLNFDLLDGVTKDTPLLSKREMDFYVENFSSKPFNNTLNWYRTNKLNWEDELALVPSNACTIHRRNPGPCAASGSVDGYGNVL
ncbi:bifunctional epoxide hydrolase 2 [Colletotrichum liriopes]|uniref:Bifunctional epoxide hydrolase 2 n=1 Tax=Colletotrichum liriopes TaxID=708192 RepID=A0AA37GRX7_9PEZI|nr:bifunctional epoxide hydrolase 2 [Colletotrichum liriopes]